MPAYFQYKNTVISLCIDTSSYHKLKLFFLPLYSMHSRELQKYFIQVILPYRPPNHFLRRLQRQYNFVFAYGRVQSVLFLILLFEITFISQQK